MRRSFAILFSLASTLAFAGQPIGLSAEEFKMFRHWQKAMQDPRVEKIAPAKRNAAIAKDAHFKLKDMEAAIQKGEAAGDLKSLCSANVKEALEGALSGQIGTIDVDTSEPHAVVYVEWLNENLKQLEEEASVVAAITAKQCPIVSSIQLWAQDKSSPKTRVFQALISGDAAGRINVDRAKDFADTRYIRLFENVKNIANGDVMDTAVPGPAAGTPSDAGSSK